LQVDSDCWFESAGGQEPTFEVGARMFASGHHWSGL
jgi:hypothetical protein